MVDDLRLCAWCGAPISTETRRFCSNRCGALAHRITGPRWFDGKYEPDLNTGCWIWNKRCDRYGYGRAKYGERTWLAHRLSYHLHKSPLTDELVCHRCDTPACINPDHLFTGTNRDNVSDRQAKGRSRGPGGPITRLSADAQRDILANCRPGLVGSSIRAFAAKHGVTHGAIRQFLERSA